MMNSAPMENGWIIPIMDMYGGRGWVEISNLIVRMDIGFGPTIMNGCGFLIIAGVGRRSIMAGGSVIHGGVGAGFLTTRGGRLG